MSRKIFHEIGKEHVHIWDKWVLRTSIEYTYTSFNDRYALCASVGRRPSNAGDKL